MKLTLEIDQRGSLYFLLHSLIGAYNRRSEIMERTVRLDERIKTLTHKLDTAGDTLQDAVKGKPKGD